MALTPEHQSLLDELIREVIRQVIPKLLDELFGMLSPGQKLIRPRVPAAAPDAMSESTRKVESIPLPFESSETSSTPSAPSSAPCSEDDSDPPPSGRSGRSRAR